MKEDILLFTPIIKKIWKELGLSATCVVHSPLPPPTTPWAMAGVPNFKLPNEEVTAYA